MAKRPSIDSQEVVITEVVAPRSPASCGNCVYFRLTKMAGQCRRFPVGEMKYEADWCGEWKDKSKNWIID